MIEINDQYDFFKNVKIDNDGNLLVSIVNFTGGTSGGTGTNGSSGSAGTSGSSGESGSSGSSGVSGELGSSGTSGESGSSGSSGISGEIGSSGTSGTSGENGSSGTSGANGTSYGFDGYTTDNVSFSFANVGSNITITNVASLNASTLAYEPGQFIIIRSTATPTAFMIAEVISWASAPSLNVNITYVSEEGTFNDVNIHLSGIQGKSNTYLSYSTSATIDLDTLNIGDNVNLVVFSSPYSTFQNTTAYSAGQFLIITNSTDSNMYFIANVISYNQTTGDLTVQIKYKTAGSNDLWIANLAGQNGDTLTYLTYTFGSTPIDIDALNIDDTFYMYLLSNDPSTLILNTGNYSANQYIIITASADNTAYIICQVLDYTRTNGSAYLKVIQKTTGNYDSWIANLTAVNGTSGSSGSSGTSGTSGTSGSSALYAGTSTDTIDLSTLTIGVDTSLTTSVGLGYTIAQHLIVSYSVGNHFHGEVSTYDISTGALTINVTEIAGSGTYSTWTTNLDGASGGNGTSGTSGTAGSSGTSSAAGLTQMQIEGLI